MALTTELEETYFEDRLLKVMMLAPCTVIYPHAVGVVLPTQFWAGLISQGYYHFGGPGWHGPTGHLA